MISAETTAVAALLASPTLTGLIHGRIYPDLAPQNVAPPLVIFERTSSDPIYTIHGQLVATVVTLTVYSWASTRIAAEQIGDAVALAMHPHVSSERRANYDPDTALFASVIDFAVWET